MTTLEILLVMVSLVAIGLYFGSKFKTNDSLENVVKDIKKDIKASSDVLSSLAVKAKEIIFDESIQKVIKEFIMIVEEKNIIAKEKGERLLSGEDKKKAVVLRLSEYVANIVGEVDEAVSFIENNQVKIDSIINDYVSFSNKMQGRSSLSEAEIIISNKLNKTL